MLLSESPLKKNSPIFRLIFPHVYYIHKNISIIVELALHARDLNLLLGHFRMSGSSPPQYFFFAEFKIFFLLMKLINGLSI